MKNRILLFLLLMLLTGSAVWGQTVTSIYSVASTTSVTPSGITPSGSSATYSQTYNTASQITSGNSVTLTLNGYAGKKISQIILSMKSNTSTGTGNLDMGAGTGTYPTGYTTIYSIGTATFGNAAWNGAYSTSYTNVTKTLGTAYTVQTGEKIVIKISATVNSLYVQTFSIVYENPITDYYWDTSTASGLGGTATWGTTFSTASAGNTALVVAPTTANAIFQGTPGTVTIGGNQTVGTLAFNVDGYTVATTSVGSRTLAGDIDLTTKNISFSQASGAHLTLSGVISGTGTTTSTIFTKNGAGTLTLSSAGNTFTGKMLVNGGFIATTGESLFGANPGAFTANQITLDGGGVAAATGNINFSSNRGILLSSGGGNFDAASGRTITLTNVVSGTGNLTKLGVGTLALAGSHTYTGNTIITAGTLQLSTANRIANASNMVLNGGTFRTGATTGYAETVGTLTLDANSTLALGTGNHTLNFANSSGVTWAGTTLTITGWTGTEGASGTAGKIFMGSDGMGLTTAQLAKITFQGFTNGTTILATGEIVPGLNTFPYFEIENTNGAFGSVCVNTTSGVTGKFDLYGYNLTGDVTIGPLGGFTFSTNGTTFTNDLTLIPSGGELLEEIRIRFTPTNGTSYNGNIAVSGGGATTMNVAVTGTGIVNVTPTVSIAITTGTNPKCSGGSVTFTATPATLSGGTAAYQWHLNGSTVGGNTSTYTTTSLANGDTVDCTITITGGNCLTSTTAASNTITMVVNPIPDTPDTLLITGDRTGCSTIELTKSNSDWYWQTTATGTATAAVNSATTYTALSTGTLYVRAKSASDCWSTALAIPVVVNNPVSITANLSTTPRIICNGGSFTALTVTATGTGLSYQWYSNISASTDVATATTVGTNSNSFTPPNNSVGTLYYYVVVSGTAPCVAVTSNIVEHTVNPIPVAPDNASITGSRTGCSNVELTKANSDWYWQTTATGTATAAVNSATTYTATGTGTLYVRAKSASDCWSTALTIPVVVNNPVSITTNLSTTPRIICNGGSFTALTVAATGTGLSYQWYSNTSASTDVATSTAVGTNSNNFTPPSNVLGTLYYYVVVSGAAPCVAVTSNIIEHTVNPIPVAPDNASITGSRTGCGTTELTKSNSDWYWQTSATGTATAAVNSATTYTVISTGTLYVRARSASNCWSTALSIPVVVNTPVNITTNLSTTARIICNGGTFTALSITATGTGLSYQWYSNTSASTDTATSTTVGTNSNSFTPPSNVLGTLYYYAVVSGTAPCVAVISNIVEHTVNPVAAITSIIPSSGAPSGTLVTITGSGFTAGSTVKFGTISSTDVQIISATQIQAVVPEGVSSNGIEVTTAFNCPSTASFIIINQNSSGCN